MSNAFTKFMQETYEHNELADIATQGCASGCASGMIYYSETIALFDKYRDDLFEIMDNYASDMGQPPDISITDGFTQFANNVLWFCAEVVAYNLTQGEYIEDAA